MQSKSKKTHPYFLIREIRDSTGSRRNIEQKREKAKRESRFFDFLFTFSKILIVRYFLRGGS
jgi:predicted glycosyltransferase